MSEWQPIETAPKDRRLLLCSGSYEPTVGAWFEYENLSEDCISRDRLLESGEGEWLPFDPEGIFENDDALADYILSGRYKPTHWMPLPAPPVNNPVDSGDL